MRDVYEIRTNYTTREHYAPELLGLTTCIETRQKDITMSYDRVSFSDNKTCNPVLASSLETNKLTGVKTRTNIFYDSFNNLIRQRISFEGMNLYTKTGFYPQTDLSVPQRNQHITYTSLMRPASIKENGITATFEYNADGDRVMMSVVRDATPLLMRYYVGNGYEYDIDSMGVETERFYIGGDAYNAGAVLIKSGGSAGHMIYRIMRDYLGSIIYITDNQGYLIQEMDYDVWGRLRDPGTLEVYDAGKEPELVQSLVEQLVMLLLMLLVLQV